MSGNGYTYEYPRPMVTVDAVIFTLREEALHVLLIERRNEPFKGAWALPGGFVDIDEDLEEAVKRELEEETSLTDARLAQFHAFGKPGRDPRGRSIAVAYWGVVDAAHCQPGPGDDAAKAAWFRFSRIPKLAFDHNTIVAHAVQAVQAAIKSGGVGSAFLPATFSPAECRLFRSALALAAG
ncbi:MAG TPA: NUDIX hydrolase [Candidatus Hydrogenedentes bacterium]|nr:NUDIX hydrolase [Candidatus Hydrogenedentota bacterium]